MGKSQALYKKAKTLIPGGTQLLSKRPEMFLPDLWPAYYEKAKGCEVWDLDGNKYLDMSIMGVGACILGYADDDVDAAVKTALDKGSMTTLNAPEEVELAELLIELHPWAEMVRYARSGGEAMAVATRIARAKAGREDVLFCGYHGWHDWYLAANLGDDRALDGHLLPGLQPAGVHRQLKGTALTFLYNDLAGFHKALAANPNIGVVVMETPRNDPPQPGFYETIRKVTREKGIVLVFDEITAGFRLTAGGAHLLLSVTPDIAVFAKAISNGVPMAAIIGTKKTMQAAQDTFISSTYWTERLGPAAALATIKKFRAKKVHEHLVRTGEAVQQGWQKAAQRRGLDIHVSGIAPLAHFDFKYEKPLVLKTLFTQLMLERGFLAANALYASYAHQAEQVGQYLQAVDEAFAAIGAALKKGDPTDCLKGPVCHSGFKRLN
ncbi:MAG: aminotransferase class III-fold pyridoxal phosphate-dependent enzyme [Candidatus Margulisiibacteriota bacterium]